MVDQEQTISRCLQKRASEYLGNNPNICSALKSIKENEQPLLDRIGEFCWVSEWFSSPSLAKYRVNSRYDGMQQLRDEGVRLPSLAEVSRLRNQQFRLARTAAFEDMRTFVDTGEWEFVASEANPYKMAGELMVKGYSILMARMFDMPDLAKIVVSATKELLFFGAQGTYLFSDFLEGMIQERSNFPYEMVNTLNILGQLPRTVEEQFARNQGETEEDRQIIAKRLHDDTVSLLSDVSKLGWEPIPVLKSEYRGKSQTSIERKLFQSERNHSPIRDLYGCRFVLPHDRLKYVQSLIEERWPTPQVLFIDRIFSVRSPGSRKSDYDFRHFFEEQSIEELTQGKVMNIVFDYAGQKRVGEVQLLTPEGWEIENKTRESYHQR